MRPAGCSTWWAIRVGWDTASRQEEADRMRRHDDDDDDDAHAHERGHGHGRDAHGVWLAAECDAPVAVRHKSENEHRNVRPAQWYLPKENE